MAVTRSSSSRRTMGRIVATMKTMMKTRMMMTSGSVGVIGRRPARHKATPISSPDLSVTLSAVERHLFQKCFRSILGPLVSRSPEACRRL
ncbi:hypothetical protein EYF80_059791 [Liparis tanakae]|uniref:Uncharacterized protein n=1 Tax=Liparis tanakae TaxID=230148 RepID=A0A4Z2ENA2_9TELE|nr:hypothetical protein EYF80_059791 [Liparis tanakae]